MGLSINITRKTKQGVELGCRCLKDIKDRSVIEWTYRRKDHGVKSSFKNGRKDELSLKGLSEVTRGTKIGGGRIYLRRVNGVFIKRVTSKLV